MQTDILEKMDKNVITQRLMEMLEIRDQEDQKIGITKEHVAEIKAYLKALDLITDGPWESTIPYSGPGNTSCLPSRGCVTVRHRRWFTN